MIEKVTLFKANNTPSLEYQHHAEFIGNDDLDYIKKLMNELVFANPKPNTYYCITLQAVEAVASSILDQAKYKKLYNFLNENGKKLNLLVFLEVVNA